jgi:hydroxymethylpyrimidine/phosphomethylpyrimidine kinase
MTEAPMKTALSIAGTDPSGGAGLHADLKTFEAHGVYGMGAITAIVAQNTLGVTAVEPASAAIVRAQLDAVFGDIVPDAVKIGMLPNADVIAAVAGSLLAWKARNVVIDTVMVSSSGHRLLDSGAERDLVRALFPLARVITPNIPEAEALTGIAIASRADMSRAAKALSALTGAAILLKGGHLADGADDLLLLDGNETWFTAPHMDTRHTHGTGCTLSSAIASNLALGLPVTEAVERAKAYVTRAILYAPRLGKGHGPLLHRVAI